MLTTTRMHCRLDSVQVSSELPQVHYSMCTHNSTNDDLKQPLVFYKAPKLVLRSINAFTLAAERKRVSIHSGEC